MPRAEVGTPKYLANAMKSKGLQRLRWYCQICSKQCRDDNGFKCHIATESHLRQAMAVGESAGKHISDFSQQFQSEHSTNRVKANNVYQEYIQDKNHLHMNATKWLSLSEFVKHLGRTGVVRVEETEKGFFISWIDNSPKALAKAEASQKKERATTSDEQRERMLIREQIERANAQAGEDPSASNSNEDDAADAPAVGLLQREEGAAPLRLAFGIKKASTSPSPEAEAGPSDSSPSSSNSPTPDAAALPASSPPVSIVAVPVSAAPVPQPAMKFNAFKKSSTAAPVKVAPTKVNVFKMGKSISSSSSSASTPAPSTISGSTSSTGGFSMSGLGQKRGRDEMPAAQRLILEEEERKRRRMGTA